MPAGAAPDNDGQRDGNGFPLPLRNVPLIFVANVFEDDFADVEFGLFFRRNTILSNPRTVFFEGALPPIIPRGLRPAALQGGFFLVYFIIFC